MGNRKTATPIISVMFFFLLHVKRAASLTQDTLVYKTLSGKWHTKCQENRHVQLPMMLTLDNMKSVPVGRKVFQIIQ